MSDLLGLANGMPKGYRDGCYDVDDGGLQIWPTRPNPVLAWLANATCDERYLDNIFFDLCRRLEARSVPIVRASVFLQIDHPQWCGLQVLWCHGMNQPKLTLSAFGTRSADPLYERSVAAICDRRHELRIRLQGPVTTSEDMAISECLRRECLTDYVAWPLPSRSGSVI